MKISVEKFLEAITPRQHSVGLRYAVAVFCILPAWAIRASLTPWLGHNAPYTLFITASVVAAWFGGLGPGLTAMLVGGMVADYFYLPEIGVLDPLTPLAATASLTYMLASILSVLVVHVMHQTRWKLQNTNTQLEKANRKLEERVAERTIELQEKSRFLEAFFRHSLDSLVFLDKQFNFIRVNEAYARACQRDVSEFPGRNHFELYPNPENRAIFEDVVRTRKPFQAYAKPFVFPDHPEWGTTYWNWALVPVLDAKGEVDFLVFSLRDVTKRELAEQEVRKASRYARSLIEASLDPLVTISPEGKITDVNQATEQVTGAPRERLIGSDFSNYFTEPGEARAGYQKVISEGKVRDYPLTIRHASGRTVDVLYNAVVYRNEEGRVQGVFAAARDITELKATEKRRNFTNILLGLFAHKSSSKEYFDSVVEVIRDWSDCQALGIRVVDDNHEIPYESCVGFEPGFLDLEKRLSLAPDTNCCCIRAVKQIAEEQDRPLLTPGGSFRCDNTRDFLNELAPEKRIRYRGNCIKFGFASLAVIPIRYRDQILGAIHLADRRPGRFPPPTVEFIESMAPLIGEAVCRFRAEAELDRHRQHLEERVKLRTAELERSNRDLEQFAYVASHDLQEPLRAVAGYADLLQTRSADRLDEKSRRYIGDIIAGATRMQTLISDLLAFSRLGTRGKTFQPTDLNAALGAALASLATGIQESHAEITRDPLPVLYADPSQIAQLFQNLIGNAIKFRGDRPPEIHVGVEKREGQWRFFVRDNGIGIEPQYFQRIFQIFQRLHTRRVYAGTGIGLAICKRIVERHGGTIGVESEPGRGTTFHFILPEKTG